MSVCLCALNSRIDFVVHVGGYALLFYSIFHYVTVFNEITISEFVLI